MGAIKKQKIENVLQWVLSVASAYLTTLVLFYTRKETMYDWMDVVFHMQGLRMETFCCILGATFLYRKVYGIRDRRVNLLAALGGAVFALCHFFGFNIYELDTLWKPSYSRVAFNMEVLCLLGTFLIFNAMLRALLSWIQHHPVSACAKEYKWFGSDRKSFFLYFGIVLLAHLCCQFILYPGVTTRDTYLQMAEGLGILPLSDYHPYIHTLIIGGIIRLGSLLFGSILHGIALCVAVQCVLLSLAVAGILTYMARRGIHPGFRIAALGFFTLYPVVLINDVTLWKDIWQGYCMLAYGVFLMEIAVNPENFFRSKGRLAGFAGVMLGVLFFKNTGIFVILVSLPFLIFSVRGNRKKALLTVLTCVALFAVSRYVIIPQCGILQNKKGETMSVPLQQIARTLSKDWDGVSQEQKDILGEILPCEEIRETYDPRLSDAVKDRFKEDAFAENPQRYLSCWLEMGKEHPKLYLESFLANSAGYWYTGVDFPRVSYYHYLEGNLADGSGEHNGFVDPNAESYDPDMVHPQIRSRAKELTDWIRRLPAVATAVSLAFAFWSCFTMMLACILKRQYRRMLPLSAVLGVFLVCILSPVFAECRYAYLAILIQPSIWPFVLQDSISINPKTDSI